VATFWQQPDRPMCPMHPGTHRMVDLDAARSIYAAVQG
jgi:hypothetical protein